MNNVKLRRFINKTAYRSYVSGFKIKLFLFVIFAFLVYAFFMYNNNLKPVLNQLGSSRASKIGQNVVNETIEEIFSNTDAKKLDIIKTKTDENGKISAIIPDIALMNNLKAQISSQINENLSKQKNSVISVPLGTASGISYLSGLGPKINFNMLPYGKIHVDFTTDFKQAGINQTKHEINVTVSLDVALLLSNRQTATAKIKTTVPVSETVIVGDVPESYTNFVTDEEKARDDAVNMLD